MPGVALNANYAACFILHGPTGSPAAKLIPQGKSVEMPTISPEAQARTPVTPFAARKAGLAVQVNAGQPHASTFCVRCASSAAVLLQYHRVSRRQRRCSFFHRYQPPLVLAGELS
jgi:hypothetical protein